MFLTFLRSAEFVHQFHLHVGRTSGKRGHILRIERHIRITQQVVNIPDTLFKTALHLVV
nr:MAG TPA: hypothetical protein [Caudoviricetes sp.]